MLENNPFCLRFLMNGSNPSGLSERTVRDAGHAFPWHGVQRIRGNDEDNL